MGPGTRSRFETRVRQRGRIIATRAYRLLALDPEARQSPKRWMTVVSLVSGALLMLGSDSTPHVNDTNVPGMLDDFVALFDRIQPIIGFGIVSGALADLMVGLGARWAVVVLRMASIFALAIFMAGVLWLLAHGNFFANCTILFLLACGAIAHNRSRPGYGRPVTQRPNDSHG